jgi:hypothetical protein
MLDRQESVKPVEGIWSCLEDVELSRRYGAVMDVGVC